MFNWCESDENMKLYHGTATEFDKIEAKYFRRDSDFGEGFYLTSNFEQAKKWASIKSGGEKKNEIVYCYKVPKSIINGAKIIDFSKTEKDNLNWLRLINYFRNLGLYEFKDENINLEKSLEDIDIIKGPIYDNYAKNKLKLYFSSKISIIELNTLLKMQKSDQWCFKSKFINRINLDNYQEGNILNG